MEFTKDVEKLKEYDIGKWTYGTPNVIKYRENGILKIGKFCSIAQETRIMLGGEHEYNWVSTYPFKHCWNMSEVKSGEHTKGDVIIGNDVWIGGGVMILSGVEIGDGAVIGTNSVVARSVSPYSVVAGNPAKEIKKRFDDETIFMLQRIRWWDWSDEKIFRNIKNMGNIKEFLKEQP